MSFLLDAWIHSCCTKDVSAGRAPLSGATKGALALGAVAPWMTWEVMAQPERSQKYSRHDWNILQCPIPVFHSIPHFTALSSLDIGLRFASLPLSCGNWPEWGEAELSMAQKGPSHFYEANRVLAQVKRIKPRNLGLSQIVLLKVIQEMSK